MSISKRRRSFTLTVTLDVITDREGKEHIHNVVGKFASKRGSSPVLPRRVETEGVIQLSAVDGLSFARHNPEGAVQRYTKRV